MKTKVCAKCDKELSANAFHNHNSEKSCKLNKESRCKVCRAEDVRVPDYIKTQNKLMEDARLQVNILSEVDASYIAAFVDGEGSLSLNRNHSGSGRTTSYVIRIRITNTFKPVIDWIADKIGFGSTREVKLHKNANKQAYEWYINGRRAIALLKQLYPYLIVKKAQADVLFEFSETLMPPGQNRLHQDVIEKRHQFKLRITELNS